MLLYQRMGAPHCGQRERGVYYRLALRETRNADVEEAAEEESENKPDGAVHPDGGHVGSIRCGLKIDVHADSFDQHGAAALVVAGVVNELRIERVVDAAPGVEIVVSLEDVLASIVQLAVA